MRYLYQDNRGPAAARNAGLRQATGEWLAFLDSDDYWLPEKLAAQMDYHLETGHEVSQTEEIWIRKGVRVNPMRKHRKPSGWIFEPSLALCLISPSSVMMSRRVLERIGMFDESFPVCEDYELWLRLTLSFPVGLVAKPLVVKEGGHPDQLSKRFWGMDRFRIQAIEKILSGESLPESRRACAVEELEWKCRIYANGCLKRNRTHEARVYLDRAKRYAGIHEILPA